MSWSASNCSGAMVANFFAATASLASWASDAVLVALYDNSVTPDKNASFALNAYGSASWGTAGGQAGGPQVYQAGQWAQGGVALGTKTNTFGSGTAQAGAANTASGSSCTLSNAYGCLVYDDTLAGNNAFCWNYFGTPASVTAGTLTIVWSASGIMQFTIT